MPVKMTQAKEPKDMLLSSKIRNASIKHHIWCGKMIQGFRISVWTLDKYMKKNIAYCQ